MPDTAVLPKFKWSFISIMFLPEFYEKSYITKKAKKTWPKNILKKLFLLYISRLDPKTKIFLRQKRTHFVAC